MVVSPVVTAQGYLTFPTALCRGEVDLVYDSVKAMLLTDDYYPDIELHEYLLDIDTGAVEVVGTGYSTGGVELANKTVTLYSEENLTVFTADSPEWSDVSFTGARYLLFYVDSGNIATSRLISYMDFHLNRDASGDLFTVVIPNDGIFSITAI